MDKPQAPYEAPQVEEIQCDADLLQTAAIVSSPN